MRDKILLVLAALYGTVLCRPSLNNDYSTFSSLKVGELGDQQKNDAAKYLNRYGYSEKYADKGGMNLGEGIKDFQHFAGLLVTGELDSTTLEWMKKNRCGLKDPPSNRPSNGARFRVKRFNRQGTWWKKGTLTWQYNHRPMMNNAYERYPSEGLKEEDIRGVLRKAMSLWQARTNIEFVEKPEPYTDKKDEPDIIILFGTRRHAGDPFPFDGQGGTLAHAFYPLNNVGYAGDVHFDDDEQFTINNRFPDAKDLLWVATHELGHSLGLDHSRERDAVMYPFYMGYRDDFDLKYDDIIGIQTIYGGKAPKPATTLKPATKPKPVRPQPTAPPTQPPEPATTTTPAPVTPPVPPHKVCPTSDITAIWDYRRDGRYFMITKTGKLYTIGRNNEGMVDRNIDQNEYYKVPQAIDAVYQSDLGEDSDTIYDIIFTSAGYYLYNGFVRVSGPHNYKSGSFNEDTFCREERQNDNSPLKLNFPTSGKNAVDRIDAVLKWQRNNKVYFFTGDKYWRYDESRKMFDCGYPRLISPAWRGLKGRIDAAYSSTKPKKTFFTVGDDFYEFDDKLVHIKEGYPKSLKKTMLKCEDPKIHAKHIRKRRDIRNNEDLNQVIPDVPGPEP